MGERKQLVIPNNLKEKYGSSFPIWSYSRLSTFHTCPHEYYLGRILKKEGVNNIYGLCGGNAHDILERLYNGEIAYEDMANRFEQDFLDVEVSDYKFTSDVDKNEKMMKSYKGDIIHFFETHQQVPFSVLSEREVWIEVGDNVFIGYVDAIHRENGYYIITDYKTSSISEFQGVKLHDKQQQLLLYAMGLSQLGIPLEKIKIRWNFLKYTNVWMKHMISVTYTEKDKPKTSTCGRSEWVSKVKTQLKKDIATHYEGKLCQALTNKELKMLVNKCVDDNNLDSLPIEIQDQYILTEVYKMARRHNWIAETPIQSQLRRDLKELELEAVEIEMLLVECASKNSLDPVSKHLDITNYQIQDCYIYGEVNQANADELIQRFCKDIEDITAKGIQEDMWEREPIGDNDSFYCNVLCGYKRHCKYYTKYLNDRNMYSSNKEVLSNDDLLSELEEL